MNEKNTRSREGAGIAKWYGQVAEFVHVAMLAPYFSVANNLSGLLRPHEGTRAWTSQPESSPIVLDAVSCTPTAMPRARLLLIDDHTLFRTGLKLLLADSPSVASIIEAGSVMEAVQAHGDQPVDIVLLDIQMPGLNGIEGVKVLRRHFADARILIVSGTSGIDAIPADARKEIAGFLPKSADAREIEEAIACCLDGGKHFPPNAPCDCHPGTSTPVYEPSQLTPRQLEVLNQLNLGRSNKVIAYHLGLSENTVRVHVAAILDHLGVVSRVEAILEAQRRGLVQAQR